MISIRRGHVDYLWEVLRDERDRQTATQRRSKARCGVNKTYAKGKVSEIRRTLVYGTPGDLERVGQNSDWRSPAIS